ncbi:peptidase S1 and S6 chymotrypsin/Hap [Haliscomenobacter hydrossis DSM 1100]|uniref:Peptidase S1 and S6 chymotrypsin/Hap n=2 Tax=Haliscomenobacter TaxID=2349 RepID=F4KTZ3_HALH1|nr:peptidase S1 and S6 chymotrypsin/Hap [Haliscomenobacter hydrossis DSM 1100]
MRILLAALLLVGAFFAGAAWRNKDNNDPATEVVAKDKRGHRSLPTRAASYREGSTPEEEHTIALFERAAPSVCYITTSVVRRDFWSRNVMEIPQGSGSGFVWDRSGHIITNYHVIQGASKAQVTLADRSTWDAELVGSAPEKDLAVLKIKAPTNKMIPIPVGTSEDLRVGQAVYAIGNPFGLDQTLTTGIVSALGREIQTESGFPVRDAIQTDAAINPGNSGGPLLDSSGRLIGVNTAIYSPSGASAGIGFSIPVAVVRWAVPELIKYGKIKRPSLGVELLETSDVKRNELEGPLVMDVTRGGPAASAGLRATRRDEYGRIILGDIIVAMNNKRINTKEELILELENYQAGDEVTLTLLREQREVKVKVRLAETK